MFEYDSIGEFWRKHVPAYQSGSYRPLHIRVPFHEVHSLAQRIREISARRSDNRIMSYVMADEMERVRAKISSGKRDVSIRFGAEKRGHGYARERGDFCLVGAVYHNRTLTTFYRSIELIGGFGFDLVLLDHVARELEIKPLWLEIWAVNAFVFALKGNSNEKLYPKLKGIFDGKARKATRIPGRPIRRRSSR